MTIAKQLNLSGCHLGCDLICPKETRIRKGPRCHHGKGHFTGGRSDSCQAADVLKVTNEVAACSDEACRHHY